MDVYTQIHAGFEIVNTLRGQFLLLLSLYVQKQFLVKLHYNHMNAVLTTFYRCRQHKVGRVLLSVSGPSQKAFQRQHFFVKRASTVAGKCS